MKRIQMPSSYAVVTEEEKELLGGGGAFRDAWDSFTDHLRLNDFFFRGGLLSLSISFIPMLLFNIGCFYTNMNWSVTLRAIWGLGMYFVLVFLYTCVNVTYSALPTVMTRDAETRSSLSAWRMTFTFILGTVLGFSVLRIINALGGDAMAYTKTALLFSIIAIPMFLICVAGTREIVGIPYEKHSVMS